MKYRIYCFSTNKTFFSDDSNLATLLSFDPDFDVEILN